MAKAHALIMAAGTGERFGTEPKQFSTLLEKPMMVRAIEPFADSDRIDTIRVAVPAGQETRAKQIMTSFGMTKVTAIVAGGETRQESVWNGLQVAADSEDLILIHDAARACVSEELIHAVLDALSDCAAVVPTLPVVDTLVRQDDGKVDALLDRAHIAGVQTPQGFRYDLIVRAHRHAMAKNVVSSDDGSLVYALGEDVRTIAGERSNIKITIEEDIRIAEAILALQEQQ